MIIADEEKFAKDHLESADIGDNAYGTLFIISKYLFSIGLSNKEVSERLTSFIFDDCKLATQDRQYWNGLIKKICSKSKKQSLFKTDGVVVTKSELDRIEKIGNIQLERLAFTMLVVAKFYNSRNPSNNGLIIMEKADIFAMAHLNLKQNLREAQINSLYRLGLIEPSKKNTSLNLRVKFIDDDSPEVLRVSDFREVGYEYQRYAKNNIVECESCGVLMRTHKNSTNRLCSDCAAKRNMVKTLICEECGEKFVVLNMNSRSTKCPYCYRIYRDNYKKENRKCGN